MEEEHLAENFDDFTKQLNNEEIEEKEFNIDDVVLEDGVPLKCPYCDWKGHPNAKDKKRGLKNHIKKCKYNPKNSIENEEEPQQKKVKKVNIDLLPPKVEEVLDEFENVKLTKDEQREKLIGDLDILAIKFDNIPFTWNYNQNSSLAHLKRQKTLFMRVLNDEAGTRAMFKLLVIGSKAVEKVADVSKIVDLDGYSQDVDGAEEEIYPILKNLVDTGVLSVGHLTPELRLGMIMTSLAIGRVEKNKLGKSSFLEQPREEDDWC